MNEPDDQNALPVPADPSTTALTDRDWGTDKPWKTAFLISLSRLPNVSAACRHAGISHGHVYNERRADPAFADAWNEAREVGLDLLEQIAHRRATVGEQRRIVRTTATTRNYINGDGDPVVETTETTVEIVSNEIDNAILMRLLAAHRPETWGPHVTHRHTGDEGGPVRHEIYRVPDADRLDKLMEVRARIAAREEKAIVEGTARRTNETDDASDVAV